MARVEEVLHVVPPVAVERCGPDGGETHSDDTVCDVPGEHRGKHRGKQGRRGTTGDEEGNGGSGGKRGEAGGERCSCFQCVRVLLSHACVFSV